MRAADEPVTIDLNPREQRFYDRLRGYVVKQEPGRGSGLRDILLLLPDLVVLLFRLSREPRVPIGGEAIALIGAAYLLSPIDLIPEILGPIGFADDLVVAGACLSRLLNYVHPDVVRSHWSGQGDALDAIQRVTQWSEDFVMVRLPAIFRRLR